MKLALDHHYSPLIATGLRDRDLDSVAVQDRGWQAEDDEPLLDRCAEEGRALLTNNVTDFVAIARRWQEEGRSHFGLVFTSDSRLPRTRNAVGRYVDALALLMRGSPGDDGFVDRIHWL